MVSEVAFGKLKSQFRVFYRKCESSKESVKVMGLVTLVFYDICLEMWDILPRSIDLAEQKRGEIGKKLLQFLI